jgi:hypothetical protein
VFLQGRHASKQVTRLDALQIVGPLSHLQPGVRVYQLASLDGLISLGLGLGLLPGLHHLIHHSLDIGVRCYLGLLLRLLVKAWHPDIIGPFLGWEKLQAGHHLISLLDCNLCLFLLLQVWLTLTT